MPPPIVLCARKAKRPKPPNGTLLLPVQRKASRSDGASTPNVPSSLSGGCALDAPSKASLSGALASQRRQEIGERETGLDRFAVPDEMAVGAETARYRRPSDLEFHVIEPLDVTFLCVTDDNGAVVDANLRKRRGAVGIGRQRTRQRPHQPGPVREAVGQKGHCDRRPHQR